MNEPKKIDSQEVYQYHYKSNCGWSVAYLKYVLSNFDDKDIVFVPKFRMNTIAIRQLEARKSQK